MTFQQWDYFEMDRLMREADARAAASDAEQAERDAAVLAKIDAMFKRTEKKAQPLVPQTFFERFVLAVCFVALVGVAVVYGMLL